MGLFDEFANDLATETLSEMAENFFGARKAVEDELEHLQGVAEELRTKARVLKPRVDRLYALLLDGEAAPAFFKTLNLTDCNLARFARPEDAVLTTPPPFSWTRSGRYAKLLARVYRGLAGAIHDYRKGRVYTDAQGAKRPTPHYDDFVAKLAKLHARMAEVNESHQPSCVMAMARHIQSESMGTSCDVSGTLDNWAQSLDSSLALTCPSPSEMGVPALSLLPEDDLTLDLVRQFGKDLYKARPRAARTVYDRLTASLKTQGVEPGSRPNDAASHDDAPVEPNGFTGSLSGTPDET